MHQRHLKTRVAHPWSGLSSCCITSLPPSGTTGVVRPLTCGYSFVIRAVLRDEDRDSGA